jgi:hypothetical protein
VKTSFIFKCFFVLYSISISLLFVVFGISLVNVQAAVQPGVPPANTLIAKPFATGGSNPELPIFADMNGDSRLDIVVANKASSSLAVLKGNGDGTFQTAVTYATGSSPFAPTTADLDKDGDLDVIVTLAFQGSTLDIFLNNGSGVLTRGNNYSTGGTNPAQVLVLDINKDTNPDLLIPNNASGTIGVRLGNGDGTFQAVTTFPSGGANPTAIVKGDFDADDDVDIAVSNDAPTNNLVVFLNNGTGTFVSQSPAYTVGSRPAGLRVLDLNADNKLDLIVGVGEPSRVMVLLGNGNGTFQLQGNFVPGSNVATIAIGDFNFDQIPDIARLSFPNSTKVIILLGNGDGTFRFGLECELGFSSARLESGDVNNDGATDLVISDTPQNRVVVVLSDRAPTMSISDRTIVEGDSGTTSAVFTVTLSAACCSEVSANFTTQDGTATVADNDYSPVSGVITFAPGVTSRLVTVTINSDTRFEPDETFTVTLSSPVNATIADAEGIGTIVNDDTPPDSRPAVSFLITATYATGGSRPENPVFADLNGDGKLDIAVPNKNSGTIGILIGNGDGTFQAAKTYAATATAFGITVGDLDSDGDRDIVLTHAFGGSSLEIMLNNGSAVFTRVAGYMVGGDPAPVTILDINNDSKPDLLVPQNADGTIAVLLGNGNGTFQAQQSFASGGQNPTAIVASDFDSDGDVDLAVANDVPAHNITIFLKNAAGSFVAQNPPYAVGARPGGITAKDLNNDGKTDLIVGIGAPGKVTVLLGNGNGTFQVVGNFIAGTDAHNVKVADYNEDGILDIVRLSYPSNTKLIVMLGKGDGTFDRPVECELGFSAIRLDSGDINGDGKPDLVISDTDRNRVLILINGALPSISVSDTAVVEKNSGTTTAVFTVTLSAACCNEVKVNYATQDGTATLAGNDYTAANGLLTFAPGELSRQISVTVNSDIVVEPNEIFTVTLSSPVNATLNKATATGTIFNDDTVAPPTCEALLVTKNTDDGTGTLCGTLSYALAQPVTTTNAYTITFALTTTSTITFTGELQFAAKAGVTIDGGINAEPITLSGNGVPGDGLRLSGGNRLYNLTVRGFSGRQIVTYGTGNRLELVRARD